MIGSDDNGVKRLFCFSKCESSSPEAILWPQMCGTVVQPVRPGDWPWLCHLEVGEPVATAGWLITERSARLLSAGQGERL